MRFKLKKLWRISVYNRKTGKLITQTMPSATLEDQQRQLLEDGYSIEYKDGKAITSFFMKDFAWNGKLIKVRDHIAIVERIEGAYTPFLETKCKEP